MHTKLVKYKFAKYLSSTQTRGNIKFPNSAKGDTFLCNSLNLSPGMQQRLNVQPDEVLLSKNKERIGIHANGGRQYNLIGEWAFLADSSANKRKVRIFQKEINQMQTTPYNRQGFYTMQFENTGFTRSNAMLWETCSDDPYHKWSDQGEILFPNMEAAYVYAKQFGHEVSVIYPHERFHEFKSYAHNFPFIKEYPEDIGSMEEVCIENLEKKLEA